MPVERKAISVSQLAELLGEDPARLLAIERRSTGFQIVTEPEVTQTSGTFPALKDTTIRKKPRKPKK